MLGKFTSPAPALNKKQSSGGSSEADAALSTDGPAGGGDGADSGLVAKLQELLLRERTAHAEAKNDLQVERDAHDDTAEKMVELQQRLEVTLQELSNLERFVKRQQVVAGAAAGAGASDARAERLLKEEAYLKSRLAFVQQELAAARGGGEGGGGGGAAGGGAGAPAAAAGGRRGSSAKESEERIIDSALSI